MKLSVLGKYGPFPAPGGACSGYLLEAGDVSLVLDLGSGTLSRLRELKPLLNIDAVLLSHLHSDHAADMLVLRYALQQLSARGRHVPLPLSVVAPDAPEVEYRQLTSSGVYDMLPIQDKMRIHFQDVSVSFHRMIHPVPTYAMVFEHEGKKFVYTGDTGYHDDLPELCMNADLLLADTCFLQNEGGGSTSAHLTTREVAALAKKSHVRQLLCTHIWGGGYSDAQVLQEVSALCPGAMIAEEMHEYYI